VEDDVRAGAPLPQCVRIMEIAPDQAHVVSPAQPFGRRRPPDEARDGISARAKRAHQVRTYKAGAPGHEDVHRALS